MPLLDHLREAESAKGVFGTCNALAIAYLLPSIDPEAARSHRLVALLRELPTSHALPTGSMGVAQGWESIDLWSS